MLSSPGDAILEAALEYVVLENDICKKEDGDGDRDGADVILGHGLAPKKPEPTRARSGIYAFAS